VRIAKEKSTMTTIVTTILKFVRVAKLGSSKNRGVNNCAVEELEGEEESKRKTTRFGNRLW